MAEFTRVEGTDLGDIKIFTLSTCGWCRKTKAFMKDHNVAYSYIDVDLLSDDESKPIRDEQLKYNPDGSFPTIVVDSEYSIIGYDLEKLNGLIGK